MLLQQSQTLPRHCCRFGKSVEQTFVFSKKSKQTEHVKFVSTSAKGRNFTLDIVAKNGNKVERCFNIVAGEDGALLC